MFYQSWAKHRAKKPLSSLETQIVAVMLEHPEYHDVFNDASQKALQNPKYGSVFMHLGLHLALRDQIALNRPAGIATIHQQLCLQNPNDAEHLLMNALADCLWQAQQKHQAPDEQRYLEACRGLLN